MCLSWYINFIIFKIHFTRNRDYMVTSKLKDCDVWKDWGQEKRATEDEMVGGHRGLNGREFEQTLGDSEGQGSLACCSPCRVEHNCATMTTIDMENMQSWCASGVSSFSPSFNICLLSWGHSLWPGRTQVKLRAKVMISIVSYHFLQDPGRYKCEYFQ